MIGTERLRDALRDTPHWEWVDAATGEPEAIGRSFAAAGRRTSRAPLPGVPGWTVDEAARALLLTALPTALQNAHQTLQTAHPPARVAAEVAAELAVAVAAEVGDLYRYGDADEKRAVLKALPLLPVGPDALPLVHDAIRTNDARLVAAALGPYARHLDQAAWRQAVLKCVFMGVPLAVVDGLDERADAELAAMLAAFAAERAAAGRPMPDDAAALLHRLTSEET
ncbi:MAG TPA: EboA domain-containing protein [Nonomuraea sp.]|nr:EboA domain-containing protein [Nonomuraea sp.]